MSGPKEQFMFLALIDMSTAQTIVLLKTAKQF